MSVLPPYTVTVIAIEKAGRVEDIFWGLSLGEIIATASAIIAFFSTIIAGIALCSSIHESRRMEKHNRLSVKPSLRIKIKSVFANGIYTLSFQLQNQGVGPALVKRFAAFLDEKEFIMPKTEQKFKEQVRLISSSLRIMEFGVPSAMAKGESYNLLTLQVNGSEASAKALADRFNFIIGCQSIYEDDIFPYNMREDDDLKDESPSRENQKG